MYDLKTLYIKFPQKQISESSRKIWNFSELASERCFYPCLFDVWTARGESSPTKDMIEGFRAALT